jgi:hypothetical protein
MQIHQPNLAMIKPEMSVKSNFLGKKTVSRESPPDYRPSEGQSYTTGMGTGCGPSEMVWPNASLFCEEAKLRVVLRCGRGYGRVMLWLSDRRRLSLRAKRYAQRAKLHPLIEDFAAAKRANDREGEV